MKKHRFTAIIALFLVFVVSFSFVGCTPRNSPPDGGGTTKSGGALPSSAPTAEKPLILKLAHVFSVDTPMDRAAKLIAQNVEKDTKGAIKIQVAAKGALPTGADGIEQCIRGANYISLYDISVLGDWVPDYIALCGPFLVDNREEFHQLCESAVVEEMNKKAETIGVKVLAIPFNFGFRNIGSNKVKIDSFDDMKGVQMRVPNVKLYLETFNALGCHTLTTPSSDVYNAIQTGLADAHETSLSDMVVMQMQEVLKYVTITKHFLGLSSAVMSNEVFNTLTPEQQKIMIDDFKAGAEWCSAEYEKEEVAARKVLEDAGVQFIEDIDLAPFKEATKVIYSQKVFPKMSEGIYEKLSAELETIRSRASK